MNYSVSGTLPVAVIGNFPTIVSLRSLLNKGYDAETIENFGNIQISYTVDKPYPDASFWDPKHKSHTRILQDGKIIEPGTVLTLEDQKDIDAITFRTGNMIYGNVQITLSTGTNSVQQITLKTVPKELGDNSNFQRVVTAQDIVDSAHKLAATYNGVPNTDDCYYIADTIASAAGAPMPEDSYWPEPNRNVQGGYWRIVHKGTDDPVEDWQSLLKPGDIVRLEWANNEGPHSFTVTAANNSNGKIEVVDNGLNKISQHWPDYQQYADPASITIYRIAADGLFLIQGSAASETLYGTLRSDDLRSFAGADTLFGGSGNDSINGGLGADWMIGGRGNDLFFADNVRDVAVEAFHQGADTVKASVSYVLSNNVENLILTGHGNLNGTGNSAANLIRGNGGDNILAGKLGNDVLSGGGGKNTFLFDTAPSPRNVDHIEGFSKKDDVIALDNRFFKGLVNGALPEDAFKDITDGAALDANDRILYNHDSGRLWIDANGSDPGARVQFAILDDHPTLTFQNFEVV